jgi:hypothetical protein
VLKYLTMGTLNYWFLVIWTIFRNLAKRPQRPSRAQPS